ncbi:MAG TPA: hypothetical protein VGP77_07075 [Vicinamibacterales bacterium]|nr:hypothetical protein [Vicinamibacterales bacterium]
MNTAIDEVAREMTEETRTTNGADFRRRVLARIASNEAPRASWRAAFVLSPVALAAALVIAVMFVRGPGRVGRGGAAGPQGPARQPVATTAAKLGAELAPPVTREPETTRRSPQALRRPGPFGPGVTRAATAASDVEALAPPALDAPALAIATLTTESIALDRLETPARIAIAPLATPEGERQ